MQARTEWTHSDIWLHLAPTPECSFKIGDQQSEENRRNSTWRAICNIMRDIDARCGVVCLQSVFDSPDRARPLWQSHSALMEIFSPDVAITKQGCRNIHFSQLLGSTFQPEMMFRCHSQCHIHSLGSTGSNGLLFPTSPVDSSDFKLNNVSRKASSCIYTIAVRHIRICRYFELIIPWFKHMSILRLWEIWKFRFVCIKVCNRGTRVELRKVSECKS